MASDCHTDGRLGTISITTQRSIENLWWKRCSWSFAAENAPVPAHTPSVLARITRHGLLDQNSCPCMQIMIMGVAFATKWGWGWGWLAASSFHPPTDSARNAKENPAKEEWAEENWQTDGAQSPPSPNSYLVKLVARTVLGY